MEQTKVDYQARLSEVITWLRFPLIFMIILLHCYSTVRMSGDHGAYFKILYPFSLWLGETGVPVFFFISGYLFYYSNKRYIQKLKTRFHTLFIPYMLWNAILLGLYLLASFIGYPQDIQGKSIANYSFIDYIRVFWDRGTFDGGNFVPILCPLWYIRNLLIMSLLSPLFYYPIRFLRESFIVILTFWWLFTPHNALIPQTVLFFCAGAYFSILNKNPLIVFLEKRRWYLLLFATFAIIDIYTHTIYPTAFNQQIHRLALIANIPCLYILADYCCQHGYTSKLLPNSAFIVFCVHYPIVVVIRKISISIFIDAPDLIHVILYFLCVVLSTAASIFIYILMDKHIPKIKNILSGNR